MPLGYVRKLFFLYRNKSSFPPFSRKRIVESVFLSILDYGDIIYRHASVTTLKILDSVYHSALRFITGEKYDTHHCILYNKVGWSSLADRRKKHWYLFIFKALIGKQPLYISSMLEWYTGAYMTRSNNLMLLRAPRASSDLGKSAFSVDAPNSWNALQHSLRLKSLPSLGEFKRLLSDHCVSICNCF